MNHHLWRRIWTTSILFLVFLSPLLAQEPQDTTQLWKIETQDGNVFVGQILEQDGSTIRLRTERLGIINIPMADVKSLTALEAGEVREGRLWAENPQDSRYFWTPSGYGLKKGEGYYQNVWVLFNQVAYGITDNVSIGAGMVPLFLFAGTSTPIWITPKVSIPVVPDKFNIGAGALLGVVVGEEDATFGIPYGILTFGGRDLNLSLGLGYGFAGGDWSSSPALTLSGMFRISPRSYLLTENLFIPGSGDSFAILSFGGRTVWTSISLDYGLVLPVGEDVGFVGIPWLGLVVPFGKRRAVR